MGEICDLYMLHLLSTTRENEPLSPQKGPFEKEMTYFSGAGAMLVFRGVYSSHNHGSLLLMHGDHPPFSIRGNYP